MKAFCIVAAVLGLTSGAQAHYTFDQLIVNGAAQGTANTYIRKHQNGYMPTKFKNPPSGSITPTDADFTCNKGAVPAAKVFKVKAGDKIGMKQAYGGTGMQHPGPAQVYMSPVADATAAGSSGQWYKVHQSLLCKAGNAESLRSTAWCSWNEDQVWFTVPSTIPNGQYLVRGEHIGLHGAHNGEAEFFYACAQLEVTGNSATSMPGTGVSIPGVYKAGDAPVNFSVWGQSTSYNTAPGPDVIPGGTIRGSADGASGDVSKAVAGGDSTGPTQPQATQATQVTSPTQATQPAQPAQSTKAAATAVQSGSPVPTSIKPQEGGCGSTKARRARRAVSFMA